MLVISLFFSLVMVGAASGRTSQLASPGGLVVEQATIDTATGTIAVRVRNEGKRTIVAWGVNTTLTDTNGATRHTAGGIDGYESDVRTVPDDPVLRPNGVYTITLDAPPRFEPVSVTASPAYAIFDDNSAVGEERSIESWFRRRAQNAVAWQFIERTIEDARASATTPVGILQLVDAEIAAAAREIHDSRPAQEVAIRIRVALRSAETAQSLLQSLSVEAGSRRKAAASRSLRRQ
jgi:hypothetical protein